MQVKLRALGNCRQATSLALYCHDRSAMDLPSSRELELESSLRERTTQVSQLKVRFIWFVLGIS